MPLIPQLKTDARAPEQLLLLDVGLPTGWEERQKLRGIEEKVQADWDMGLLTDDEYECL